MSPFRIREADKSDREDMDYVRNIWRNTFRMSGLGHNIATPDEQLFAAEMKRVFAFLLPSATIRIACDQKDETNRVGFAVATVYELHYAYVNGDFRKLGLVPKMLDGLKITQCTFLTMAGVRRMKPKERGWSYCPRYTIH